MVIAGEEFNERLFAYAKEKLEKEYPSLQTDPETPFLIRSLCETTKINLSKSKSTTMQLSNSIKILITRKKFEEINRDLFDDILKLIEETISKKDSHIDYVVLSGGSCNIPKMQEILKTRFGSENIRKTINPSEVGM